MSVSLSKRLMLCAGLVAGGKTVCDVGTDHALLPVYLVENGVCERAHACDIADGPLKSAQKSVEASPCADRIRIIKSDGLDNVSPEGISDVVIAGMGGELIIDIVARAEWLKHGVNLVLQPNTREPELISWLYENGYEIICQRACEDGGFLYTAMRAVYTGSPRKPSETERIVGALDPRDASAKKYIIKQASRLETAAKAMSESRNGEVLSRAKEIISRVKQLYRYIGEDYDNSITDL